MNRAPCTVCSLLLLFALWASGPGLRAAPPEQSYQATVRISLPGETGTGVIVHADDARVLILTALHVVDSAETFEVSFRNDPFDVFEATLLESEPALDLALLQIQLSPGVAIPADPPEIQLGPDAEIGEAVYAIGHAGGTRWAYTPSAAVISGFKPQRPYLFGFAAGSLKEGYSGGPVFAEDGRLVGIVDAVDAGNAYGIRARNAAGVLQKAWRLPELNRLRIAEARPPTQSEEFQKSAVLVRVGEELGGGVAIHHDPRKIMILTTLSLVDGQEGVTVSFADRPDVAVPVTLTSLNPEADLAMLRVVGEEDVKGVTALPVLEFGANPTNQDSVFMIGHRKELTWSFSRPVAVVLPTVSDNDRRFGFPIGDSSNFAPGAPVLTADGRLVGLTADRNRSLGHIHAIKIETILAVLREQWQIREHNLLQAEAEEAPGETTERDIQPLSATESRPSGSLEGLASPSGQGGAGPSGLSSIAVDPLAEGLSAAEAGDCEAAVPHLQGAARVDRSNQRVQLELGRCLLALERCDDAERALSSALRRNPGSLALLRERAGAYTCLRRDQYAIDDLTSIIDIDTTQPEVFKARGALFMARGDYQKAAFDYQAAYKLNDKDADALEAFGRALIENGDTALGQEAIDAAAKMR